MRWGSAAEAGFDGDALDAAFAVAGRRIGGREVPGGVLAVGRRGVGVVPRAFGWRLYEPEAEREPATADTLFDLASLTKVVATATGVWQLIEGGELALDDRLVEVLPPFAEAPEGETAGWRRDVLVRHLLTHTSGLPAGRDVGRVDGDRSARLAAVATTPLTSRPGERMVYSDLGFMLLGALIETISGSSLDSFCRERIFAPLGMVDTGYRPPDPGRTAATEWKQDAGRDGHEPGFVRGVVHDENARSLGGVSGHAGLFSTASDLGVFADALLSGGVGGAPGRPLRRILSAASVERMTLPLVIGEGSSRTLGWQGAGQSGAPYGDLWSARVYGHTGFTGTALWIDPERDVWVVLLTNAVHMGRAVGIPATYRLRTYVHNAVVAAASPR